MWRVNASKEVPPIAPGGEDRAFAVRFALDAMPDRFEAAELVIEDLEKTAQSVEIVLSLRVGNEPVGEASLFTYGERRVDGESHAPPARITLRADVTDALRAASARRAREVVVEARLRDHHGRPLAPGLLRGGRHALELR